MEREQGQTTEYSGALTDPRFRALQRDYAALHEKLEAQEKRIDALQRQLLSNQANLLVDSILMEHYTKKQQALQQEATTFTKPVSEPYTSPVSEPFTSPLGESFGDAAFDLDALIRQFEQNSPSRKVYAPDYAVTDLPVQPAEIVAVPVAAEPAEDTAADAPPEDAAPAPQTKRKKKGRAFRIVGEVIFYGLMLSLVAMAWFIRASSDGAPKSFAGYTGMIVLTESMQDVIPKGALVVTKVVEPETLQIGDDITYMANQTTSVTHRIIGIQESYLDTNQRAFETKGTMNSEPDKNPVPASNVVGKVIYHSAFLGSVATFVGQYWPVLIFLLVIVIVLTSVLKRVFAKEEPQQSAQSAQTEKPKQAQQAKQAKQKTTLRHAKG